MVGKNHYQRNHFFLDNLMLLLHLVFTDKYFFVSFPYEVFGKPYQRAGKLILRQDIQYNDNQIKDTQHNNI
jgi:hypothetical protein